MHRRSLQLLVAALPLALPFALVAPRAPTSAASACRSGPLLLQAADAAGDAAGDAAAPQAAAAAAPPPPKPLTMPPESFSLLIDEAASATLAAIGDGQRLIEVEFPPLPISKLEDSSLSAYDILSANLQFALEFAKRMPMVDGAPQKVALTLPDSAERQRAAKFFGDDEPFPGTQLWSLNGGDETPEAFSPMALFGSIFKQGSGQVIPAEWCDMHLIVGASCQELPAIQKLSELAPNKPLVCFNLKLDVLRGDLGLPAFPPKTIHHEFLCRVKPVYYLRPRSYSLSLGATIPDCLPGRALPALPRGLADAPRSWQVLLPPHRARRRATKPRHLQVAAHRRAQARRREGRSLRHLLRRLQAVDVVGRRC